MVMNLKIYLRLFMVWSLLITTSSALGAENHLIFATRADVLNLNPNVAEDSESILATTQIYESLVKDQDRGTEIVPELATSWEASADGKTWTFNLRQGVKFHDGTDFDADAVVFAISRQMDPNHPFHEKKITYAANIFKGFYKSISKVDRYTVRFELKSANATFLSYLAGTSVGPIPSPTYLKKLHSDPALADQPVGTGPFKIHRWNKENGVIDFVRFQDYWGENSLDKLTFEAVKDNSLRYHQFKNLNRFHGMIGFSIDSMLELSKATEGKMLQRTPGMNVGYMALNTQEGPLQKVKVRQAIAHAINKNALVKLHFQGMAIPAKNPLPKGMWGYNDAVEDYPFDHKKAKSLLKEAGYDTSKERLKIKLWAMPMSRPYMLQPQKTAIAIKNNLKGIGIDVEVTTPSKPDFFKGIQSGGFEMTLIGWVADINDPDNFLFTLLSKETATPPKAMNLSLWKHDEYSELVKTAQTVSNPEKRKPLYEKAQEIFHEEMPFVPLAHGVQAIGVDSSRVEGIILQPKGLVRFHKARIK